MKFNHHSRQAETRLMRLRDLLLDDMEEMQAALPADAQSISEADERRARILTMMTRALDVMSRMTATKEINSEGDPQSRDALLANIEQKLARLAQTQDASSSAGQAE